MTRTDRRGERVALLGLIVSMAGALLLALLSIWSQHSSTSLWGASFLMLGVVGIWVLCYLQLHHQRLVAEERQEVAELERHRREKLAGAQTIFDEEELNPMESLAMGRRLRWVERYLIRIIAHLVADYHFIAGLLLLPWSWQFPPLREADTYVEVLNAPIILFFTGGIAFVTFMLSRYILGLSRLPAYSALRAGGNFLFGSSAVCLMISISLLCEISGLTQVEEWLGSAIALLLIFLSLETHTNFVLDFYRPRIQGQYQRPFYDSRFWGIFSEPAGILRNLANTIDYQFGFKVSETWFYKLMGRVILPLLLVQIAVIFALTCFVVVPPGHQAVIEHYGQPLPETAKPGIHVTQPWPIDRATIIPVEQIQRMVLGFAKEGEDEHDSSDQTMEEKPPILWTKKHYKKEYKLLVADSSAVRSTSRSNSDPGLESGKELPVNLLSITMPVQWRVRHENDKDVIQYYSQSSDVAAIIESLAYRELTRYAASADIMTFLGGKGIKAAEELHQSLQRACDGSGYNGEGLGVEIVYLGIGGVHPPPDEDVAQAYQDVVSAIEQKDANIKEAGGNAAKVRVESGGIRWRELYDAIVAEEKAAESSDAELAQKTATVERLLRTVAGGEARRITTEAEQAVYASLFGRRSEAESYQMQLAAYKMAPRTYRLRAYLRTMEKALQDVRKYVIVLDHPEKVLIEADLKPPQALDILGAELMATEEKSTQ